ncbi:insulinase family protein [Alkalibaculum bacchi]|uniref:insulinase family protein n=1 Tax=Alkalibaculum bacchi TaxID=645887 RepID=UPI0026F2BD61|nr:insulinase family protein [Alkalibaculum bacchi]
MIKKLLINNLDLECIHVADTKTVCINLLISVGANCDNEKKGVAHFLEHMLIEALKNDVQFISKYRLLGTTSFDYTSFEIECVNDMNIIEEAFIILENIINGRYLSCDYLETVRRDIEFEFEYLKSKTDLQNIQAIFLKKGMPLSQPIGTKDFISKATFDDTVLFHKLNYHSASMFIFVVGPVDFNSIQNNVKSVFNDLKGKSIWQKSETRIKQFHVLKKSSIFNINSNGSKIYIENSYVHLSLYNRVVEDFALMVLDNIIEDYLEEYFNLKTSCNITKIRILGKFNYICIAIKGQNILFNDSFFIKLYYFIKNILPGVMTNILNEYIDFIKHTPQLNACVISDELRNNFLYGEPIYDKEKYLECLYNLQLFEIIDVLYCWLYQSKPINL